MRQLEFDGDFDGAICTDTSFGYFSDAENLLALRGITRAVRLGGRVLMDMVNREQALRQLQADRGGKVMGAIQETPTSMPRKAESG